MTKRIITPFSSSIFFLLSPVFRIRYISTKRIQKLGGNYSRKSIQEPCGIHVARTESLLFRLLKAVLIPTTIKYLLFPDDSVSFNSSDRGEPLRIDSCVALAAANSISKFEIVLSSVLHSVQMVLYQV